MAIRSVFFDCGNVLVTYETQYFFDVLKSHSRNKYDPKKFFGTFDKGLFVEFELGHINTNEFFNEMNKRFDFDFAFGVEEFVELFSEVVIPDLKIIGIKDALNRNDLDLVLVTNNNHIHMDLYRRKYPDVLSNFVFSMVSSEVGIRKPDLEMFKRPMEALGLQSNECLLIEDRHENLEAFRSLGGIGYCYNPSIGYRFVNDALLTNEREHLMKTLIKLGLLQ
jgi:glucose-1-phosphatase